jgi:hypothetical protein
MGSARDSRAGDGDLAVVNFFRAVNDRLRRGTKNTFQRGRRNQHARRVRSPESLCWRVYIFPA